MYKWRLAERLAEISSLELTVWVFGFASPVALCTALEEQAALARCSCGGLVFGILEEILGRTLNLNHLQDLGQYGRVRKTPFQKSGAGEAVSPSKGRMPGTVKLGRTEV